MTLIRILELLLDKGANINLKNTSGKTPLMLACELGKLEACEFLLEKKASVEICDDSGKYITHYAVPNLQTMQRLLERNAPVNVVDRNGNTPLMLAVCSFDKEDAALPVVKALLKAGARADIKNTAQWTPLHEACSRGWTEMCKELFKAGAPINAVNARGRPPIYYAAVAGNLDLVQKLYGVGAVVSSREFLIDGGIAKDIPENVREFLADVMDQFPTLQSLCKQSWRKDMDVDLLAKTVQKLKFSAKV